MEKEPEKTTLPITATKGIYAALAAVTRDIEAIGKNAKVADTAGRKGWTYRSIDDIMNALHPLYAQYGILVAQRDIKIDLMRGEKATMTVLTTNWALVAEDGSELTLSTIAEGLDYSDKGATKAASIGLKYALTRLHMIPFVDMVDGDAEVITDTPTHATEAQKETIRTLLETTGTDHEAFCKHYGVPSVNGLNFVAAAEAIIYLQRKPRIEAAVKKHVDPKSQGEETHGES